MSLAQRLTELLEQNQIKAEVRGQEPMSAHTSFRVGGPAEVFVTAPAKGAALIRSFCREEELPFLVIGRGTNLLAPDEGLPGVVLTLSAEKGGCRPKGESILAEAGAGLSALAGAAEKQGLGGLEFAAGIPGSVGGGIVMNAGAYGGELKDVLRSVKVLTLSGEEQSLSAGELELSYRRSNVTERGLILLEGEFALSPGEPKEIREKMEELARRRKEKQPLEFPSAGSTFKRPEGSFAGKLIEDAGLRGFAIGGAQVSEKHCGFVINRGGATAKDIKDLIREVQRRVLENSGILLEPEVKIL